MDFGRSWVLAVMVKTQEGRGNWKCCGPSHSQREKENSSCSYDDLSGELSRPISRRAQRGNLDSDLDIALHARQLKNRPLGYFWRPPPGPLPLLRCGVNLGLFFFWRLSLGGLS